MQRLCGLLVLIVAIATTFAQTSSSIKIATYNIRIRTDVDSGAINWNLRKFDVARLIKENKFDLFGVQEMVDSTQNAEIKVLLPQYSSFSVGRNNQEGTKGERIGLFFKSDRFEALQRGSFFLSPTPDVMSKGWDAALRRICIWQKLRDKQTNHILYAFCTHFDHKGVVARVESARLIVSRVKEIAGDNPVVVLGDLNASMEESDMYKVLTSSLADARTLSPQKTDIVSGTFNGFDITRSVLPSAELIDYIFCRRFRVNLYKVLNDKFRQDAYPSDHFPVMIHCTIE